MMSARGKTAVVCLLCLLFTGSVFAQQYRVLTANDFQGTPRANYNGVVAYTNCSISYSYDVRRENGIYKLTFKVPLMMNNQLSWLNRKLIPAGQLAEVLKHEQGHYIIAYLQQQEILRTFARTRFGRDYNIVINDIFNRIDAKYKQLNIDYENDTNHMVNRVQQNSWDKYLDKCLNTLPPVMASY
jgi:hypothetical protein